MKRVPLIISPITLFLLLTILFAVSLQSCKSQPSFGAHHMQLIRTIVLPEVKGRIDHMDVNLKDQILYVAALGNNSLEVVNLNTGKIVYSIKGLLEPQGVGYIPQTREILVANAGNGDCYFYSAQNFEKTGSLHLKSDADDVRYDSNTKKLYVGYGEGGIAVIEAESHKQLADIKLQVHPESFQIDQKLNLLFVNLLDAKMVGAVALNS
jgi:hypothetical protein